jgi:hypothetical protein
MIAGHPRRPEWKALTLMTQETHFPNLYSPKIT